MRAIKLELSPSGARTFWRVFIAVFILSTVAIIVLGELALRRWAPWGGNAGMSILAAWVWMYHLLPVLRRQRSVLGGLARAFLYTGGVAVLIVAGLYLAHR